MRRVIPSIHGKSHEDKAYHEGRSGDRSALARALDPYSGYSDEPDSYAQGQDDYYAITTEEDTYDLGGGPLDMTRRNRGVEWAPTEYEQLQNRNERDQMLDSISDFFKENR